MAKKLIFATFALEVFMKKILVALDNSNMASIVLQKAIELAKPDKAELILLQAFHLPVDVPADIYYRPQDELAKILQKEADESLQKLTQFIPAEIPRKCVVELGVPWQSICDRAQAENADMIVIGKHGYSLFERMIGTTAGRVVNHADRSVLIVYGPEMKGKKKS